MASPSFFTSRILQRTILGVQKSAFRKMNGASRENAATGL
jgi:hypothetical protein